MAFPNGRRGFLQTFALATGALLVGVGRAAADVPTTIVRGDCSFCRKECSPNEPCPHRLHWMGKSGLCIECYESADAAATARREHKNYEGVHFPCQYCAGVKCTRTGPLEPEREPPSGGGAALRSGATTLSTLTRFLRRWLSYLLQQQRG